MFKNNNLKNLFEQVAYVIIKPVNIKRRFCNEKIVLEC